MRVAYPALNDVLFHSFLYHRFRSQLEELPYLWLISVPSAYLQSPRLFETTHSETDHDEGVNA